MFVFAVVSQKAFIVLTTLSLLSQLVLVLVICVIRSTFCQGLSGARPYLKVEDPSRRARRHRRPCRRRRPIRTETTTVLVLVLVSQGTHLTRRY